MPYNLLDLRTRVRNKINDSSYSASVIDGFLDDAQLEIAEIFPWRYFNKVVGGSLTVDEYTYEQQDDHQSTSRLIIIDPIISSSYWDLTKRYMPSTEFFERFPTPDSVDSGRPTYWTEYGDQIYFNCPVDKAYVIRQFYQKVPAELTGDESAPELKRSFRELLVLGASYRCEEERENYDIAATLQNRFNDQLGDKISFSANETTAAPDTVVSPNLIYEY